jgi:excisionase family DNA binding protein
MTEVDLMTVEEVADLLRIGVHTVRAMIRRGDIPALKIGKQYRIKREDFNQLLAQAETK